jgi:hypothetical protein
MTRWRSMKMRVPWRIEFPMLACCQRVLGIDNATMTHLIGKLDMRRYEVLSRPGDDREKVLRLKAQIRLM